MATKQNTGGFMSGKVGNKIHHFTRRRQKDLSLKQIIVFKHVFINVTLFCGRSFEVWAIVQ